MFQCLGGVHVVVVVVMVMVVVMVVVVVRPDLSLVVVVVVVVVLEIHLTSFDRRLCRLKLIEESTVLSHIEKTSNVGCVNHRP